MSSTRRMSATSLSIDPCLTLSERSAAARTTHSSGDSVTIGSKPGREIRTKEQLGRFFSQIRWQRSSSRERSQSRGTRTVSLVSGLNPCCSPCLASRASLTVLREVTSVRHGGFSSSRVITNEESLRAARMSLSEAGYVSLVSIRPSLAGRTYGNLAGGFRLSDKSGRAKFEIPSSAGAN